MTDEERLKQFLLAIHMDQGKVCENYGTCDHISCKSNQATWELADSALQGKTLEQHRQEKFHADVQLKELAAGNVIAVGLQCFKCGSFVAISKPAPNEEISCRACYSKDVALIDLPRDPEGYINNCGMRYESTEKNCQMCVYGPCPEAVKFEAEKWAVPTKQRARLVMQGQHKRSEMELDIDLDREYTFVVGKK